MANNKEKLQKILGILSTPDSQVEEAFKAAHKGVQQVVTKIKEESDNKAKGKISEVMSQVQSLFDYLDTLKGDLQKSEGELSNALAQNLDALRNKMSEYRDAGLSELASINGEMDTLKDNIREISARKIELPDYSSQINAVESSLKELVSSSGKETDGKISTNVKSVEESIKKLREDIAKLRADAMSAIASTGGGNMNRNILVSGNPSTLGRYTDVNLKPGSGVTISYQNNDNLKTTDITVAATGGGGTSRSINTVIVSSVVAATASTDIVVIAGAGIKLDMPTAVGNTNLYTIKNKFASSVMVAGNGAETIDGDANIILAVKYVSVDLISDNANWHIT